MKPSLAHLSPTLPAVLATGAAVTLSVFLLAGAEPQGAPAPLLPAIGGAAVHVVASLPGTTHRASKAVTPPASQAELATTSGQRAVSPQGLTVSHAPRPAHHPRVHRATPSPAQVASRTVPAPVVRRQTLQATPAPRGKARGHSNSHGHSHGGRAAPAAAHLHGHGNVLGHTHHGAIAHSHHEASRGSSHHGASHGHADKTSGPSHPEHAIPPKTGGGPPTGHGGGNGHGGKQ